MSEYIEPTPELQELAQSAGLLATYWSFSGRQETVSAPILIAALKALGIDAQTPEQVTAARADLELESWRHTLPQCTVTRQGFESDIFVHVPHGDPVALYLELEGGGFWELANQDNWVEPRVVDGVLTGQAKVRLPGDLPLGYHYAVMRSTGERAPVIVTPRRLDLPADLASRQHWGVQAQLYSVRSSRSWGLGDFADLAQLADYTGRQGADFLLINPLHAAEPVAPLSESPYLPSSRRYVNPIYIRPESIAEAAYVTGAQRELIASSAQRAREESTLPNWRIDELEDVLTTPGLGFYRDDDGPLPTEAAPRKERRQLAKNVARRVGLLNRDLAGQEKMTALREIFSVPRSPEREVAFRDYVTREGEALQTYALWAVAVEQAGALDAIGALDSPEVAALRETHAERIEFWCWLQWIADEQAAAAQGAAKAAGHRLGIMTDLAVGVHPGGAESWGDPEVFAQNISVGAPPDPFNAAGQDWSAPPWRPDVLAARAYEPYRNMLAAVMRNSGALRIDHILGLFRLWWIPAGYGAANGVYLRYNHEAMIGILLLEAHRAGAVIIGEDLGTVEPWVRDFLADRGVLGTSVLWFERSGDFFISPRDYRHQALVTATTHDLPPTAGYLAGDHLAVREHLGLLESDLAQAELDHKWEVFQVLELARSHGLLQDRPELDLTNPEDVEHAVLELHRLLTHSPSALLAVALTDAVGDTRPQNMPGTFRQWANWIIPLADSAGDEVLLDDLWSSQRAQRLFGALGNRRA